MAQRAVGTCRPEKTSQPSGPYGLTRLERRLPRLGITSHVERVAQTHGAESFQMAVRRLTGVIEREGDGLVALCPEIDVASQGDTIELARANLQEVLELFFETASDAE